MPEVWTCSLDERTAAREVSAWLAAGSRRQQPDCLLIGRVKPNLDILIVEPACRLRVSPHQPYESSAMINSAEGGEGDGEFHAESDVGGVAIGCPLAGPADRGVS